MDNVRMKYGGPIYGGPIIDPDPDQVKHEGIAKIIILRHALGLNLTKFGSLLGVDPITVMKWEVGDATPSKYEASVIQALSESLEKIGPKHKDLLIDAVHQAPIPGGLAYLLIKVLETVVKEAARDETGG